MANDEEKIIKIDGKSYEDIKIGSDPELKFEGINARPLIDYRGKFGTDGPNAKIGELRPDPYFCPINHVAEIERVLRNGYKRYPKIQNKSWLAGTIQEGSALGGHIHFGSTYKKDLEIKLEALDTLLAPIGLLLEVPDAARTRRSGEYGRLAKHDGTFNDRNRGFKTEMTREVGSHPLSHPGYEYRPLASWLVSRPIASGILSLAKVIAFQAHNKSLHNHLWTQLKFIPLDKKFSSAYINCDRKFFLPHVVTIHRIISSFKLYPKYEKYINYLFHIISQNKTWEDNLDLKKRWNIIPNIESSSKDKPSKLKLQDVWQNALDNDFFLVTNRAIFLEEEAQIFMGD